MTTLQCLPLTPEPVPETDLPGTGVLRAGARVLPLRAVEIDTVVVGLAATTRLRQRFANAADAPIEVTYVFPLPSRAAVTSFTATLGGRRITGLLKERAAAREAYDLAVASGQRAAIAEEDRPEVFSIRVGNLMPGEDAVVELELTGPVAVEAGEATYRFPLVVAERYTSGAALAGEQSGLGRDVDTDAVPDASRVTPPRYGPADGRPDLDIVVRLDAAGLRVANLRSTLHAATVEDTGGVVRLRLEVGQRLDRDLLVRWDVAGDRPETSVLAVPDPGDPATGTWSLTIVPPASPGPASRSPRDVVVLLDRSGSMAGWKMVAARRAAARIVDSLDRDDRFQVLGFDHVIEHPGGQEALVPATDRNRFAAVSWLSGVQARGGTEMAAPLQQAAARLAAADDGADDGAAPRRRALVLVTDGQISGEDHVLAHVAPLLTQTRVFAVGVDRAVNAGFLDRLAGAGRGQWELVESEDRLDDVLSRVTRLVTEPAFSDLHVMGSGIQIESESTAPRLAPDAYPGSPCSLSGRYRLRPGATPERASLRVTARPTGAGTPLDVTVTPRVEEGPAVRAIWARTRVRDLEDIYASGAGQLDGLAAQIVATSLRFGVLSRFTAFVAVDEEQTGADQMAPVAQPVENVSGWAPVAYSAAAPHQEAALGRMAGPSALLAGRFAAPPMTPPTAQPARMVRAVTGPRSAGRRPEAPGAVDSVSDSRRWPTLPETVSLPWLGSLLAALEAATRSADTDRLRMLARYLAHAIRLIEPGARGGAELVRVEQLIGRALRGPSAASWEQLLQAVSAAKTATGAPDAAPLAAPAAPAPGPGRFWRR